MEQQLQLPRQIAYIVQIKDILNGTFVKDDGWNPHYVIMGGKHVSRVNIIGVVIGMNEEQNVQTIRIDDGTGKIKVMNFEKRVNIAIGDVVLLVGRVREYGNERYIASEIIKNNIDSKWSAVWKRFLLKSGENIPMTEKEDIQENIVDERSKSWVEQILIKIRELDDGDGVPREEVIRYFDEKAISNLLLQGEIFEIKPGRLKVID